ncbi:MAG: phosphodiester glycosidase family protein [Oscillochloridaceae bacterium umkhey_bin13]
MPPAPLPTLMPTPSTLPLTATPQPLDTGWQMAAPGVELRRLRVELQGQLVPLSIVRLDPTQVQFRVGYAPDQPPTLSQWARQEAALAVINGGFFDAKGRTVALLVQAGQPLGSSYVGRGGMFAVAPDGTVSLRALSDLPYDPSVPISEGLQGWPTLVRTAGEATYTYEDGQRSRRSVLAMDQAGRVLLIAAPTAAFTLAELSHWLATADLEIATAINLDGGSSTGLWLSGDGVAERIDPFVGLPIVLIVTPRSLATP